MDPVGLLLNALGLVGLDAGPVAALGPVDAAGAEALPFPLLTPSEGQQALLALGAVGEVGGVDLEVVGSYLLTTLRRDLT